MKLKRIIAGITACTIVGSTMFTMPISAKTITKVEEVTLSDLLNTAKMAVNLKDDLTAEKQAEILDKFDTNGNGQISIGELLAVAQRVARTNESDIVNEYGTADSEETTTAETTIETTETTVETSETTETTVETTETTEETTTTEAIAFNPVIEIDGTEYKDGDTFVAKANKIYEVNATDAENEITVSLTGSQDDDENNLVRVNGNKFEVIADGKLTITVKTADGQEKTITLNVITEKSLADVAKSSLYISYLYEGENYYSDDYKGFSNEIGKNIFNNEEIEDSEQYWEDKAQDFRHEKISGGTICTGIGGKVEIKGLAIGNDNRRLIRGAVSQNSYEDYNTNDKITYISTDTNKVTIDENGVITGLVSGTVEIIVMVNGKEYSRFNVYVGSDIYSIIETSDEKYAFDYYHSNYPYQYTLLTEGKYVENASQGKALSLKDLQSQVGAENVKSVSVKNFDGTEREIAKVKDENGVMYYADTTTSTVYYAITSETGEGSLKVDIENGMSVDVRVLDMEQYKNYQVNLSESLIFEFRGKRFVATAKDNTANAVIYHLTEGETFSLSDIAKVSGVNDPKITITNSQNGTSAQNIDYDPLTKTFTARELTEENSGGANYETITLTYKATDGTTRSVKFGIKVVRPVVKFNPLAVGYDADPSIFNTAAEENYADMNGGKIYIQKDMNQDDLMKYISQCVALSFSIDKDGIYDTNKLNPIAKAGKITSDNEKMFKTNNTTSSYYWRGEIEWADGYKLTTGDTATITVSEIFGNPNLKASFTIEVVDELPKAVKTGIGTDKFEYPKDNKANQYITFDNIVDVNNLPDGCTLVPYVESASENVGYIDEKGEKQQTSSNTMRVDTTGIKIIQGTNGHYSISGIEVAGASKVDTDTFMNVRVKVLDGKGNTITISDPIKLSVKGEQGMTMTIDGTTKTIKAGETTDFGTIYIKEGESINFSASGISADALSVSEIDSATVDKNKGTITAKELTYDISGGNTEGKEITFTYGTGEKARTAKAKIVVVKTKIMAYYAPYGSTVEITDGETFWNASGNKITANFITEVDNYGKEKAGENVGKYEIKDGKVVFTYSKDSKITASCPVKNAEITAGKYLGSYMQVDKNVKEVTFPVKVSTGLSFEPTGFNIPQNIIIKSKTYNSDAVVFSDIDASSVHVNTTNESSISFIINAKNKNNIVVAQNTCRLLFEETLFGITINGKTANADSSTPEAIADTIYVQEDEEIDYKAYCFDLNGNDDKNATKTATSDNPSLVTVGDGKIKAGTLTGATNNDTTVTFKCTADNGQERTITAKVVVVRPVAVAPAYIGSDLIEVTGDTYFTADISKKKAEPAFATKVDENDKPILNDGLITKVFEIVDVFNSTGETVDWKYQGITIPVTNKNIDPSNAENLFKASTNIRYTNESKRDVKILTFENPWEKCSNLPDDWIISVVNADSNSEWTPKFINVSTVECTRTGNTALGDTTTLNLTAELRDKNGNLVKQDTQTLNAYIEPNITAEQKFNSENKEFTYKVNLDVSGWTVTDAGKGSGYAYSVEFNKDTKEVTVKYNTAIDNETNGTFGIEATNKDGGTFVIEVGFTATPVEVTTTLLNATYSSNDLIVHYGYTSSETFDTVSVPTGAGYTASIGYQDGSGKNFSVCGNITDTVKLTLKNDNVQITKTLPTAVPKITENNFSQSENIENKTFKYYLTDIPKGWALENAVSKDESKYKASYDGNYELTVEAVGDTTDNEVALALTFTNGGLTLQKEVTLPVSRIDSFPQIELSENTATTSDNREFFYTISNPGELSGWTIRKEEEPQVYDIDFISNKSAFKLYFTPAITATQKNMAIKYQLQKEEAGVKYISPEYTIEVTATYTPPTSNP